MQIWAGLAGGVRVNDSVVYGSHEDLRQELAGVRLLLREVVKAHKLPDKPGEGRSCQMTVGLWRRVKAEGERA